MPLSAYPPSDAKIAAKIVSMIRPGISLPGGAFGSVTISTDTWRIVGTYICRYSLLPPA